MMLKVEHVPAKGRGTFATQSIPRGTVIETAPAKYFPPEQRHMIAQTALFEYCFVRPSEYTEKYATVGGYIVFGLSSLCNHAIHPNVRIEWSEDGLGAWASLIALRDIHPGEEVTLSYTNIDEYPEKGFV